MRDPAGHLQPQGDDQLLRRLSTPAESLPFLMSARAQQLVEQNRLVAFEMLDSDTMLVPRIPFVTAPFEWCDAQLRDAAALTLDIAEAAWVEGYELKDASAWNVLFQGTRPVFCDHLSFRPIRRRQWWAFGQFLRHFSFPLAVAQATGLPAARLFRMSRDGLAAHEARELLGVRRFGTRIWPMLRSSSQIAAPLTPPSEAVQRSQTDTPFHPHVYRYARWSLASGKPAKPSAGPWLDYTTSRRHYSAESLGAKSATVTQWLQATRPSWVLDIGANTGEFSRLAASLGSQVISLEQDEDCVSKLYQCAEGTASIYPVLSNLADLCGGGGWLGTEHPGLYDRLKNQAQMVMALAVIHHLAISESIPLDRIVDFVAEVSTEHAIIEFIPEHDPMVQRLSAQRERSALDFSLNAQRAAFGRRFEVLDSRQLEDTGRSLVLMRRIPR